VVRFLLFASLESFSEEGAMNPTVVKAQQPILPVPTIPSESGANGSVHSLSSLCKPRKSILLVEDERVMASLLMEILGLHDFHVLHAHHGAEALEILNKHPFFDLIILDIILPRGLSGFEVAELILKSNPDQKILFTSGFSASLLRSPFRLEEGRNFLAKPFQPQALIQVVQKHVLSVPN
jgi:CheY-like chemotaxis protein